MERDSRVPAGATRAGQRRTPSSSTAFSSAKALSPRTVPSLRTASGRAAAPLQRMAP